MCPAVRGSSFLRRLLVPVGVAIDSPPAEPAADAGALVSTPASERGDRCAGSSVDGVDRCEHDSIRDRHDHARRRGGETDGDREASHSLEEPDLRCWVASDVHCAPGGGNGLVHVDGVVRVVGTDIDDLDRDNDGYGCD
jgi:hypothetical protein